MRRGHEFGHPHECLGCVVGVHPAGEQPVEGAVVDQSNVVHTYL
jgi:hypothetical protein